MGNEIPFGDSNPYRLLIDLEICSWDDLEFSQADPLDFLRALEILPREPAQKMVKGPHGAFATVPMFCDRSDRGEQVCIRLCGNLGAERRPCCSFWLRLKESLED